MKLSVTTGRVVKTVFYEVENKPKFHLMKKNKNTTIKSTMNQLLENFGFFSTRLRIRCAYVCTFLQHIYVVLVYLYVHNRGVYLKLHRVKGIKKKKKNVFLTPALSHPFDKKKRKKNSGFSRYLSVRPDTCVWFSCITCPFGCTQYDRSFRSKYNICTDRYSVRHV